MKRPKEEDYTIMDQFDTKGYIRDLNKYIDHLFNYSSKLTKELKEVQDRLGKLVLSSDGMLTTASDTMLRAHLGHYKVDRVPTYDSTIKVIPPPDLA